MIVLGGADGQRDRHVPIEGRGASLAIVGSDDPMTSVKKHMIFPARVRAGQCRAFGKDGVNGLCRSFHERLTFQVRV